MHRFRNKQMLHWMMGWKTSKIWRLWKEFVCKIHQTNTFIDFWWVPSAVADESVSQKTLIAAAKDKTPNLPPSTHRWWLWMIDPSHEGRHDTRQSDYCCCLAICAGDYLEQQQRKTEDKPGGSWGGKLLWLQYAQFMHHITPYSKRKKRKHQ